MSGAPQFPDPLGIREVYRPGATSSKAGPDLVRRVQNLEQGAAGRPGPGVANGSVQTADSSQTGGVKWAGPAAVSLYNPDYAGSASLATSTERLLDWNSEEYDHGGFHAAGSPGIVVPSGYAGIYHFDAQLYLPSISATHQAYIAVAVYDSASALQYVMYGPSDVNAASIASTASLSGDIDLDDGWIINVLAFQNSGSAQTMNTSRGRTRFSMHRVAVV